MWMLHGKRGEREAVPASPRLNVRVIQSEEFVELLFTALRCICELRAALCARRAHEMILLMDVVATPARGALSKELQRTHEVVDGLSDTRIGRAGEREHFHRRGPGRHWLVHM